MPSTPQTRSGRHARSRPSSATLLIQAIRRPSQSSIVKALGISSAALGLATAFASPPAAPAIQLTASEVAAPRAVVAATAPEPAAPQAAENFGAIGFKAVAKPAAAPSGGSRETADTATAARAEDQASRSSIRRTGLRGELGLSQNGLIVLNALRDNCPQVTSYGGYRPGDMDHGSGNAVDAMVSSRSAGDSVAAYVMAHADELNVKYIIWYQRIWYPGRGWQAMSDRGSYTANHMDHVHVSVL